MSLVEIIVVIAVAVGLVAVAVPSFSALLDLQLRSAAKELAQTQKWLQDEAAMRNVTFRIVYNLDRSTWKVEMGDPNHLVFGTPEEREEWEDDLEDAMDHYTQREIEAGEAEELEEQTTSFTTLSDVAFTTEQELPRGTIFAWVYTPQYGDEGIEPSGEGPSEDPTDDVIAYSYIFPDGTSEHTVVRIIDEDDPDEGWTIEVEPLTGKVILEQELVDPSDSMAWIPTEGPSI